MKIKQLHRLALALLGMGLSVSVWAEPLIVKIGSAAPKTGGIAHLGIDNENGAQLAINEINAKGDLTIGGQKVILQLVGEDDEGDPRKAGSVALKLYNEGVVAVVGHLNSGVSIPANSIYAAANMVQVSPSSTNPVYTMWSIKTINGNVSAYRVVAHDGTQNAALAQYVTKNTKIRRIAIFDDSTQYGVEGGREFAFNLENSKVKIVEHISVTDKTTDFYTDLVDLQGKQIDAIYWGGMDDVAAALVKQMRELDIRAQLITVDGACTDKFIELAGIAGEGTLCSQSGLPLSKMAQAKNFNKNYEKTFVGQKVQIYAPFAYDAVYAIVEAMKIANSAMREAIVAAMPKVDFDGVTGRIRFDIRGDIIDGPITIYKVSKQKFVPEATIRVVSDLSKYY